MEFICTRIYWQGGRIWIFLLSDPALIAAFLHSGIFARSLNTSNLVALAAQRAMHIIAYPYRVSLIDQLGHSQCKCAFTYRVSLFCSLHFSFNSFLSLLSSFFPSIYNSFFLCFYFLPNPPTLWCHFSDFFLNRFKITGLPSLLHQAEERKMVEKANKMKE